MNKKIQLIFLIALTIFSTIISPSDAEEIIKTFNLGKDADQKSQRKI